MARMRHPHVVSFMGLCRMPPCILTGEPQGGALVWCAPCFLHWCTAVGWPGLAPAGVASWPVLICSGFPAPPLLSVRAEFCPQGSLYDVLHKAGQQASAAAQLTWQLRLSMVRAGCGRTWCDRKQLSGNNCAAWARVWGGIPGHWLTISAARPLLPAAGI